MRAAPLLLAMVLAGGAQAAQDTLVPVTDITGPTLAFDWPAVQIGIGAYEEGPTGVTVFRFPNRATVAVDVRGGSPGTVNTDGLRLGYGTSFVDAIVFTGGSGYGEEAITGVTGGLKELGARSGAFNDVAFVAGSVIYDFRDHRLNEIYPDARLARLALASARPGLFPLAAQGAGRMAVQGSFFECGAHSGQGGSFHQRGALKIAAFVVVNALGAVVDREGRVVRCPATGVPEHAKISDFMARIGNNRAPEQSPATPSHATTLSLVIVNRQMSYPALQRLAVQVHTSMARAIQPFSTQDDGDTLFAVSTQELPANDSPLNLLQIDAIAGEAMWDAVLASVPEEPAFTPPEAPVTLAADQLARVTGRYRFGPQAVLEVARAGDGLAARMVGQDFYDLRGERPVPLTALSASDFYIAGRFRTRLAFTLGSDGKPVAAVINPGKWQQRGEALRD